MKKRIWYKMLLVIIFLWIMVQGSIALYDYYLNRIPDSINLRAGTEQMIEFCVPVSGRILPESVPAWGYEEGENGGVEVDFSKPFTIITGESNHYMAKLKLFGIFPYKTVSISVVEEEVLIPAGIMIGIYVETEGVLVIDTGEFVDEEGRDCAPAKDVIQAGDYILAVDGVAMERKADFIALVEESQGRTMEVLLRRDGEEITVWLTPKKNHQGEYKVGIWVRDSAQGIGTMTYIDSEHRYGSLGHGITDYDTGEILSVGHGELYATEIVSIQKGQTGEPGEIKGLIHYVQDNIIGVIEENSTRGIYGRLEELPKDLQMQPMGIAYKNEIQIGEASILCDVSGMVESYEIEILEINVNSTDNRGLVIKIVDEDLLAQTGGIVQGMSGSPIIQDGRIIGAVTHVLVNDPTRGYGIFIENMLDAAG